MTEDIAPKPIKVTAPSKTGPGDRKPKTGRKKSLKRPLTDLFTSIGSGVYVLNQVDGTAIIQGADALADSLNRVAQDNDNVYRNLERMVTGSAWGSVLMAVGAIALPIAANHNLLPFDIPGMATPTDSPKESVSDDISHATIIRN